MKQSKKKHPNKILWVGAISTAILTAGAIFGSRVWERDKKEEIADLLGLDSHMVYITPKARIQETCCLYVPGAIVGGLTALGGAGVTIKHILER